MRKHFIYLTALLLSLSFVIFSCKKDDEDEDINFMEGILTYSLPKYLTASQEVEFSVTGITVPTSGLKYLWSTPGFSSDSLVAQSGTLNAPAVVGDYTIILTVSHPDYSSKTSTRGVTVIDPDNPEAFNGIVPGDYSFTDTRDGHEYYYNKIGDLYWFTDNLKWIGAGKPYENEYALIPVYGMLYTWDQATGGVAATGLGNGPQGVCPDGWSIPTREDWENLGTALNGSPLIFDNPWTGIGSKASANPLMNSKSLWKYSPNNTKTNTAGWNAIPGGSSSNNFFSYSNLNQFGFWWSSSQKDSNNGEYRYIHFDSGNFPYNFAGKNFFGASVRCVKMAD